MAADRGSNFLGSSF